MRRLSIKVERPAVKHQTVKLARRLAGVLKAKARALASDLSEYMADTTKADDPSDEDRRRADDFLGGHDFGDWDGLADALETRAIEVFEIAARDTLVRLGFEVEGKRGTAILDVVHEDAAAFAKKRAAELVTEISERSRRMVRGTVTTAIKEGWSSRRLASEIAKSPAFDISRADMIARTELAIANSEGYRAGLEGSGVEISTKEWLLGGNPCDDCKGNADQGAIAFSASFQSGHSWTPAHPNCVCDIAVTVKE